MKNAKSMVGMPVILSGRKIGRVAQVRLSDDLTRMEGIWLDAGLRGTRFLHAESVCRLGDVAVIVDETGRRMRFSQEPLLRRALTTDGTRIGAISGALIDEITFRVECLELSHGYWDDFLSGRAQVRSYTVNPLSGEVIINQRDGSSAGGKEEKHYARYTLQGTYHRRADRRLRRDALRRYALADRAQMERAGEKNGTLGGMQGR